MSGAKDGVAVLKELGDAGFSGATILRTFRNARAKNPRVIAAEIVAFKEK